MPRARRDFLIGLGAAAVVPALPAAVSSLAQPSAGAVDPGLAFTGVPADSWRREPGVRIERGGPYARRLVAHPSNVLRLADGRLRLYYYGADETRGYILSALSEDHGFIWAPEPGFHLASREGEAWVSDPFVLPLAEGGYRLYYKAYRPGWRGCLFSARSPDGFQWEREGVRLMPGPPGSPDSARTCFPWLVPDADAGDYRLFYGGSSEPEPFGVFDILSATSRDAIAWDKEPGIRVARGSEGAGDGGGALMPAVYRLPDGRLRMFYVGGNGRVGWRAIASAISDDGVRWRKEPGARLASGMGADRAGLVKPSVVELPDGRFRMLYAGMDGETVRILSAIAEPVA